MSEPKPFASLSSGLLARKGSAKPAMRPQGYGQFGGLEDLGWNDMGNGRPAAGFPAEQENLEHVPSSISALTPAPRLHGAAEAAAEPTVIEQQRAIAHSFSATEAEAEDEPDEAPVQESAPVVKLPRRPRQAPGLKDKAAFTLRLDSERHLKLRLACAVTHRSAQQIVSEALETFLKTVPGLDTLTQQLPAKSGNRN